MKQRLAMLVALLFALTLSAVAQEQKPQSAPAASPATQTSAEAYFADTKSIESTVAALYDVISGPAGKKRDWDRFRNLFLPEGRLIYNGRRPDGRYVHRIITPQEYVDRSGPYLEKEGFFEKGVSNKIDSFGAIAHIFSTYESRHLPNEKPFARGINSIQLLYDGTRWWVVTVMWDEERPDNPIPQSYLKYLNH